MSVFRDESAPQTTTIALRTAQYVLARVPFGSPSAGLTPPPVAFRFDAPLTYTPPPNSLGATVADYFFGV